MTREEFIERLEERGYSYEMDGDKIVVTRKGDVYLNALTDIPTGVVFKNESNVSLNALTTLPPGVVFENGGIVDLRSLVTLPPGIRFENKVSVNLSSLVGGWFSDWEGNITGIRSTRILNLMISKGLFER